MAEKRPAARSRSRWARPCTSESVDLSSSTTTIPYVIKGIRNSAVVFTLNGTLPNTFGQFRTVTNPNAVTVDTVTIALTNAAASCCRNPMGLDNIVFGDTPAAPAATTLTGTVTDSVTGGGLAGATVSIIGGQLTGASTTANASGAYTLTGLTQGALVVRAAAPNYLSGTTSISIQANQVLAMPLTPDPRALTYPKPPAGATVIGFAGVSHDAAVTSHAESIGFLVSAAAGWLGNTAYGHPAPYIGFSAEPSTTVSRQIDLTAGGAPFTFVSVELYLQHDAHPVHDCRHAQRRARLHAVR